MNKTRIIGFVEQMGYPGEEIPNWEKYSQVEIGRKAILPNEEINYNIEMLPAKPAAYNPSNGYMFFLFNKPMHEMELTEDFINKAQGIIPKKSNRILIKI